MDGPQLYPGFTGGSKYHTIKPGRKREVRERVASAPMMEKFSPVFKRLFGSFMIDPYHESQINMERLKIVAVK